MTGKLQRQSYAPLSTRALLFWMLGVCFLAPVDACTTLFPKRITQDQLRAYCAVAAFQLGYAGEPWDSVQAKAKREHIRTWRHRDTLYCGSR